MIQLRTDTRIIPLALDHSENMYRWMLDPTVRENIGLRTEPSSERTKDWINKKAYDDTTQPFAILYRERHVGNVVLDRIDHYLRCCRFSIYIGEPVARGSGIGSTATYLAMLEGFNSLSLNKIYLTVHSRNYKAINTYTRLGFTLEGILRDEFIIGGETIAAFYMSVLRRDFECDVSLNERWADGRAPSPG
jgi:RimJ/RimL family protein N-acetyltransferase